MSTVTLSLEVELGWGVHDVDEYERISDRRERETEALDRLLSACDEFDVPFSFDVVDHLFHAACSGEHDSPHRDGWFDEDPGTDWKTDPLFYAPDMVSMIQNAAVQHELCTHSYSHVSCDEASTEAIRWDLEQAQEIQEHLNGRRTESFVPPKHESPPTSVLHNTGIEIVRMHRSEDVSTPRKAKRLAVGPYPAFDEGVELVDDVVVSYCTEYPSLASALLPSGRRDPHPAFKYLPLPTDKRVELHRKYLREAAVQALRTDTPINLWAHLYDLANDEQLAAVTGFLRDLAELEAATDLEVVTMQHLNRRTRTELEPDVVA